MIAKKAAVKTVNPTKTKIKVDTLHKKPEPKSVRKHSEFDPPQASEAELRPFKLSAAAQKQVDDRVVEESVVEDFKDKLEPAMKKAKEQGFDDIQGALAALHGAASNLQAAMRARAERTRIDLEIEEEKKIHARN